MISVVTPIYNTPKEVLARTWASLKAQTFTDWEWVVWDDSTNDDAWRQIYGFCSDERYKIKMFKSHVHSGIIGALKRQGFMVAEGEIIVELDHDDELTSDCLQEVHDAFADSEVGFVYSDWCEILPNGQSGKYPDGWAFGFGLHYFDRGVWVMGAPPINAITLSHIVSAPNHVRAWRSSVYRMLDGHRTDLPIADDYELCVRTALVTKMRHIPKMLYVQHIGPHTAQRTRNQDIQMRVAEISKKYASAIAEKYDENGLKTQIGSAI